MGACDQGSMRHRLDGHVLKEGVTNRREQQVSPRRKLGGNASDDSLTSCGVIVLISRVGVGYRLITRRITHVVVSVEVRHVGRVSKHTSN